MEPAFQLTEGHSPKERVGDKTDYTRGKRYFAAVERAYRDIGFSPPDVQRLWVCWQLPKAEGFDE